SRHRSEQHEADALSTRQLFKRQKAAAAAAINIAIQVHTEVPLRSGTAGAGFAVTLGLGSRGGNLLRSIGIEAIARVPCAAGTGMSAGRKVSFTPPKRTSGAPSRRRS